MVTWGLSTWLASLPTWEKIDFWPPPEIGENGLTWNIRKKWPPKKGKYRPKMGFGAILVQMFLSWGHFFLFPSEAKIHFRAICKIFRCNMLRCETWEAVDPSVADPATQDNDKIIYIYIYIYIYYLAVVLLSGPSLAF